MKKILSLVLTLTMLFSAAVYILPAGVGAEEYDASKIFVDVPADAWFKGAVDFVGSRGIMGGAGQANTFKPSDLSTRSMVAVILHRLEGEPAASAKSPFTDLTQDWYVAAADWAYESGVVKGSSATTFNPDGKVTRQEIVTMLYRYAGYCGVDVSEKSSVSDFEDGASVAAWALESVEWALGAGLINGRNDGGRVLLAPMGNTQRSEMATILSRFITKLEDENTEMAEDDVDPIYKASATLKESEFCDTHKASLHIQMGTPAKTSEHELGAVIVSALGLDPSIYSVIFGNGVFASFAKEYSKTENGAFTTVSLSFEIKNLRTVGETVKFTSFPVAVRRNDWYAHACAIDCGEGNITDETLSAQLGEFDSLYLCREHSCVHVEAGSISESVVAGEILSLMERDSASYKVHFDSFSTVKNTFDKLASGESAELDVTFAVSNEQIKKDCGYDAVSDKVTVKFSVTKTSGTGCSAVDCPYEAPHKATELFMDKYVCNEHDKAHVALKSGTSVKLADLESLMKETLDLGADYTVKLDSSVFNSGKVKVKITHKKGYEVTGPEFTPVYTTDASSETAAKFILCDNEKDAYKLIVHDGYSGNTGYGAWNGGQTESGWILDTRADDGVRHGTINDVSTTEISQVIREVNNTTKGVVNLRTGITINSGFDGAMLDFRNADGESIMRLQTKDGAWKLLQADGSFTKVMDPAGAKRFVFDITLDLYEESVKIVINDVDCGTFALSETGVNVNIQNFRFASTEKDKVTFDLELCDVSVNYAMWEYFAEHHFYSTLPQGWKYQDAALSRNTGTYSDAKLFDHYINVGTDGFIEKSFVPTSGKIIVRFLILPSDDKTDSEFAVLGGGNKLITVATDNNSFYVNGQKAYDYRKHVWYDIYLVCDTETGKVELKINGIDRGEFSLAMNKIPFDTVRVDNHGWNTVYDQFMVYNDVYHSDYVPKPVKPKGEENYVVGMNTCSMWQNGFHAGWACISAYDETRPILGYYDEGSPETADWEIKYMVEHGIDFQSFVMFGIQDNGPITTGLGMHLEDGYKYAKYKDMLDYCLIWCSTSPNAPKDLNAWIRDYIPYFIEHHFKDPSYLVLDNKPVIQTFRFIDSWGSTYWTIDRRKEAIDYLDQEVKKLGFDGVLWITEDTYPHASGNTGYDGLYSYNHGADCTTFEYLKNQITSLKAKADAAGLYYVPTAAIGFNCMGWMNGRTPLMSVEDFKKSNEWIRDEYFMSSSNCPDWAKNLTFVCTWNEYGEGHYMMPCEGLNGFGYLDVLRETYTSEKSSDAVNIAPTEAQLERINRLYPQHMRLVRAQEGPTYTNGIYDKVQLQQSMYEWVDTIDLESSILGYDDNITVKNGVISNNSDKRGTVTIKAQSSIALVDSYIGIYMSMPSGSGCQMAVGTGTHDEFNSYLSKVISGTGEKEYYTVNNGILDVVRLSIPAGTKLYAVKFAADARVTFAHTLRCAIRDGFSGGDIAYKVMPEMSPRGDYLFGADTIFTDYHILGMFGEWDNSKRLLRLSFPGGDVFEFTVGSAFCTLNGETYYLGYKLYETDGVPMIPLNVITDRLGYKLDYSDFTDVKVTK